MSFASLTRQSSSTTPIIHAIRRKSTSDMNIESTRAYTRRASLKWNKAALSADAGGFSCVRQDLTKLVNR